MSAHIDELGGSTLNPNFSASFEKLLRSGGCGLHIRLCRPGLSEAWPSPEGHPSSRTLSLGSPSLRPLASPSPVSTVRPLATVCHRWEADSGSAGLCWLRRPCGRPPGFSGDEASVSEQRQTRESPATGRRAPVPRSAPACHAPRTPDLLLGLSTVGFGVFEVFPFLANRPVLETADAFWD